MRNEDDVRNRVEMRAFDRLLEIAPVGVVARALVLVFQVGRDLPLRAFPEGADGRLGRERVLPADLERAFVADVAAPEAHVAQVGQLRQYREPGVRNVRSV